mgnify:CR=1 FL=1
MHERAQGPQPSAACWMPALTLNVVCIAWARWVAPRLPLRCPSPWTTAPRSAPRSASSQCTPRRAGDRNGQAVRFRGRKPAAAPRRVRPISPTPRGRTQAAAASPAHISRVVFQARSRSPVETQACDCRLSTWPPRLSPPGTEGTEREPLALGASGVGRYPPLVVVTL